MVSCSVLPWDNGAGVPSPSITVDTVCTKEDRIDNALDDTPHARGC
jgi:hypothetical protein